MRSSLLITAFALAVAAGCGGEAAGALGTGGATSDLVGSVPTTTQSPRVYELTASYRMLGASGAGVPVRQLFGREDREWIAPATGAFRVERTDSLSVSSGREAFSRQKTAQWDGPPAWTTTLSVGSPEFLAERSAVAALPLLRAFLAQKRVSSVGSIIHTSSRAFTARLAVMPVQVTYTIVRTTTPAAAERERLFAIPTATADVREVEIRTSQGAGQPLYSLGRSDGGLVLRRAWHQSGRGADVTVLRYEGPTPATWVELEESSARRPSGGLSFGFAGRFRITDGEMATLVHVAHPAGPAWMGVAATTAWARVGRVDLVVRSSSKQLDAVKLLGGLHRGL